MCRAQILWTQRRVEDGKKRLPPTMSPPRQARERNILHSNVHRAGLTPLGLRPFHHHQVIQAMGKCHRYQNLRQFIPSTCKYPALNTQDNRISTGTGQSSSSKGARPPEQASNLSIPGTSHAAWSTQSPIETASSQGIQDPYQPEPVNE